MYQHILATLDDSDNAALAFEQALALARLSGASLHLLHVVNLFDLASAELGMPDPEGLRMMAKSRSEKVLAPWMEKAQIAGINVLPVSRSCWGGGSDIAEEIVEQATALHADLLVMGTHGRTGLMHLMLGSVAESVMKKSTSPLLIVRSNKKAD